MNTRNNTAFYTEIGFAREVKVVANISPDGLVEVASATYTRGGRKASDRAVEKAYAHIAERALAQS